MGHHSDKDQGQTQAADSGIVGIAAAVDKLAPWRTMDAECAEAYVAAVLSQLSPVEFGCFMRQTVNFKWVTCDSLTGEPLTVTDYGIQYLERAWDQGWSFAEEVMEDEDKPTYSWETPA